MSITECIPTVKIMSRSPVEELALSDLDRSNKGASKQRRDLINAEVANMRDLLPLSESARQRLSQLQVMSLTCVFIRKCTVLSQLFPSLPVEADMPAVCDFSQSLSGFLLITTREGKLVYISENVTDYLGHSMVDMKTQGDSLYDIVDKRDEANVRAQLLQAGSGPTVGSSDPNLSGNDVSFFCRMNMSRTLKRQSAFGDAKVMHVRGHFLPLSDPSSSDGEFHHHQQQQKKYAFVAMCSPLIMPELKESLIQSNTMVFKTVHNMAMTFMEVTKTAEYHLGCSTEEICKASWYSMLHPEDIHEAREKHVLLIRANHELACMMTVRMLTRTGEIMWVNMVMQVFQSSANSSSSSSVSSSQNDEDGVIVCINQVISEEEAIQLRLQSHTFALYPPRTSELWNSTTTMMASSQQPDAICWRPASSSSSSAPPSLLHVGLNSSAKRSSCASLGQCQQALPPTSSDFMGQPVYQHIPPTSSSSPSSTAAMQSSSPVHHTDKLKLMLKRKLQGPLVSQPAAKLPRMDALDESDHARSKSCGDGQGFGRSACSQKVGGSMAEDFSWSGSSQVMPRYQAALSLSLTSQSMTAPTILVSSASQSMTAPPMLVSSGQGCRSPPLATTVMAAAYQSSEQVVPQSEPKMVTVPESYLTPDSSPASSPNPQTSSQMKHSTMPVSAAIVLRHLEKQPVFLQSKIGTGVAMGRDITNLHIKTEKCIQECGHAGHRRELPVMDASDIESFFHTLDCSKQFTAVEKKNQTLLQEMPTSVVKNKPTLEAAPASTLAEQAAYIPIKQEPATGPLSALGQHKQVQTVAKKAEDQLSLAQQSDELEELLGFFAGEMTATQLNLEGLFSSSMAKEEAEEQWLESKQGHRVCGAGHLDPFLLQGSPLDRHHEGFSPVSPSDVSGDEDSSSSDGTLDKLSQHAVFTKRESREVKKHGCSDPSPFSRPFPSPSPPTPFHHLPQASPQGVPGMEEDELYQLDKLLSLMASGNGMTMFPDSQ